MSRRFDPWLAVAIVFYAANLVGWVTWFIVKGTGAAS